MLSEDRPHGTGSPVSRIAIALVLIVCLIVLGIIAAALLAHPSSSASAQARLGWAAPLT